MVRSTQTWDMASEKIGSFVTSTLTDYNKLSDRLHAAAIMAFVHAAEHGDPSHLNTFFFGIRENDQNMLKAWLLKFSAYTNLVNGVEETKQWLGYRTSKGKKGEAKGLFVKPKTEAIRKGKFIPEDMYEGEAFFDKPDNVGKVMTLEAIFAMLAKLPKKVEKDEEKASLASDGKDVHVPSDLMDLLGPIAAKAELYLSASKKASTLNVQAGTTTVQ